MNSKIFSSVLVVSLIAFSLFLLAIVNSCDEQTIQSPVVGASAGSGPTGGGDTQQLKLSASPSNRIISIADEQPTVKITAQVQNKIGQPMPDGTSVIWTTTEGTLDSTVTTTTKGTCSVTLTVKTGFSGCSVVTAKSGDASASMTLCVDNVTPTPAPVKMLIVKAEKSVIDHKGTTQITAYVATDGKPNQNIQVNFSASAGGTLDASAAVTDASGNASVTLTGYNKTTTGGAITVTITATTSDGRTGTATVIVNPGNT